MKKRYEQLPLKDVAEIKFCIVNNSKEGQNSKLLKWLTASNLLPDNIIDGISEGEKFFKDKSLRIYKGDIIIKRIQPSYINYVDEDLPDTYAYNNLIIVRTKDINAKYLATVLNYKIKEISLSSSVGSTMPSIGRNELEQFIIPIPSIETQKLIGEIWHKSIEKKKMAVKLAQLENIKESYLINKYIKNQIGGNKNDNV